MQSAIHRWGNSLALRIPSAYAKEARLRAGSPVNLAMRRGGLVVTPVARRKPYRLADLVKAIRPAHLHGEQFSDAPQGREIW